MPFNTDCPHSTGPSRLGIVALAAALVGLAATSEAGTETSVAARLGVARMSTQALAAPRGLPRRFEVRVDLAGQVETLELHAYSLRSPSFRLMVQDETGEHEIEPPPPRTYRGSIVGVDESDVAATLNNGQVHALIREPDGGFWTVQPLTDVDEHADSALHAVSHTIDILPHDGVCGVEEGTSGEVQEGSELSGEPGAMRLGDEEIAEMSYDADVEFFQLNGSSVVETVHDIELVTNGMNVIYRRDVSIHNWIRTIFVRTVEPDPYTSSVAGTLLCEFRNQWNNNHPSGRDFAHLMTGKLLAAPTIGLAYTGVVCTSGLVNCDSNNLRMDYGLSQSRWQNNLQLRIALTAHEVGHNYGACHCNQVGCTGGGVDPDCTIMCATIGGCSATVTNFGSRTITAINSYVSGLSCLDDCQFKVAVPDDVATISDAMRDVCWGGSIDMETGTYGQAPLLKNKNVAISAPDGNVLVK